MATEKRFNLTATETLFTECYKKSPELDMDCYIRAYSEFQNFFNLVGPVFGFVASDVGGKLEILTKHRQSSNGQKYETILQMIEHEKREGLLDNPKYVSGCITLLRLHRALLFIALFLEDFIELPADAKLANAAQKTYNATLVNFHPWFVRKAACVAMYALPTKQGLINRVKEPHQTEKEYLELLPKAVTAMKEVYNKTQIMYTNHGLLELC